MGKRTPPILFDLDAPPLDGNYQQVAAWHFALQQVRLADLGGEATAASALVDGNSQVIMLIESCERLES